MIKCLIVDDESHARELIKAYVGKIPFLELSGVAKGSLSAMEIIRSQPVDLVFLDIQMPDLTGFELLQTLNPKPLVIIISAYPEFALEGFKWDVVDYLLKPVPFERFAEAVNKVKDRQSGSEVEKEREQDHFFVRGEHRMIKIRIKDLVYLESFREYTHLHLPDDKHIVRKSLSSFEKILDPDKFMRVHRSFIVSLDRVDIVYGNTIRIGEQEIPIGKNYKSDFFDHLNLI